MASQMVIFSLGVFFIEDVINFFVQKSATLHRALVCNLTSKSRPSLVRKIGTHMTWIQAHRLHIVWREAFSENSSYSDENYVLDSHCGSVENFTDDDKTSTEHLEDKIEELKKELFNLQVQVTKILLVQERKFCVDESNQLKIGSPESVVSSSTNIAPPPPPPLPPSPFIHSRSVLVTIKPNTVNLVVEEKPTCSIVEELSKRPPKLRHVERSPGGRPVRNVPPPVDPSDILTAVLKKRFEAIHSPNQERCFISPPRTPDSPMIFGH